MAVTLANKQNVSSCDCEYDYDAVGVDFSLSLSHAYRLDGPLLAFLYKDIPFHSCMSPSLSSTAPLVNLAAFLLSVLYNASSSSWPPQHRSEVSLNLGAESSTAFL